MAGPRRSDGLHYCCFVLSPPSRLGWRDGLEVAMARISVCGKKETACPPAAQHSWYSTPTQSTPTQSTPTPTRYAGNRGAQPKDGMRGRRLSEVCCACFCSSAHRPAWCYMDWSNIHVQTQDVRACGCTPRHHDIHTPNNISPVLNPVCSLLHLTLGSSAKAI